MNQAVTIGMVIEFVAVVGGIGGVVACIAFALYVLANQFKH